MLVPIVAGGGREGSNRERRRESGGRRRTANQAEKMRKYRMGEKGILNVRAVGAKEVFLAFARAETDCKERQNSLLQRGLSPLPPPFPFYFSRRNHQSPS